MKEGLLTDKGKPNDKTPKDWYLKYQDSSHTDANADGLSSPNGTVVKTEVKEEEADEEMDESVGQSAEKKKKKKKKKKKEEKSDSE